MLSYRHAFHAGNHADVLKHFVLGLVLDYLKQKDKPFLYVDTHSGAGAYRLESPEAQKNGEFVGGIARLWGTEVLPGCYFEAIKALNPDGQLRFYPGSPQLAAFSLRPQDRLRLFEMHPRDAQLLTDHFSRDRRVLIDTGDGFAGLKALLPPQSRRALILIDPPYELKEDYARVEEVLADACRRFASGTYMIWYPLLARAEAQALPRRLANLGLAALQVELQIDRPATEFGLYGSGLFIINPPWTLNAELEQWLPRLCDRLAQSDAAAFRIESFGQH